MPSYSIGDVLGVPGAPWKLYFISNAEGVLIVSVVSGADEHFTNPKPGSFGKKGPSTDTISGMPYDALRRGDAVTFSPCLLVLDSLHTLHVGRLCQYGFEHVLEDFFLSMQV